MPDAIESAHLVLQQRIAEIDSEAAKLRAAIKGLGRTDAGPRPRSAPKEPKRRGARSTARRAPRGQRREQFLAALKAKPKSKVAEIAKEIGVSANQAHGLARQLLKDGAITKRGSTLSVAKRAK